VLLTSTCLVVPLLHGTLRVGSKAAVNDACLRDPNGYISRAHAVFGPVVGGGGHYVLDLHSTNGTYVNRERLVVGTFLCELGSNKNLYTASVGFFPTCQLLWMHPRA
jgi:pSer/pThr/pTyr-binding forkhead associated (FHA) protein